jgi:carbamoyltransferase
VIGEDGLRELLPDAHRYAHHQAHAATAFYTGAFDRALVVVCDTQAPEVSVWAGDGAALQPIDVGWRGPGFAAVFSRLTRAAGMESGVDEYRVEALARLGVDRGTDPPHEWFTYRGGAIGVTDAFEERVSDALGDAVDRHGAIGRGIALGAIQRRMGEVLVEFLRDLAKRSDHDRLCLAGGFFFNTYFNTIIKESRLFDEVFVPVNPGNGGIAAGVALARGIEAAGMRAPIAPVSPFLGPEFASHEIKAVLDNCKLSYDYLDDTQVVSAAVESLMRGELVGWFRGRLEWGPRALGNRTIFANPRAPYVLENLNRYLKHRDVHRAYGFVACADDTPQYFDGPARSPYMECEYRFRDPDAFASIRPPGLARARVQTVERDPPLLRDLLKAFGRASGLPVLVNTSFNGFHEPVVCDPRDAVRVFYGTGVDVLIVGNFLLRK